MYVGDEFGFPVYTIFKKITGNINAAILISYIMHKTNDENKGHIVLQDKDLCRATNLTPTQVKKAKSDIRNSAAKHFMNQHLSGLPANTTYDFDIVTCRKEVELCQSAT